MNTFQSALSATKGMEFPIGEDKNGSLIKADLLQINHLLASGTTGSGKSVFADSLLLTLIFHNPPERLRLILCDTKTTEFSQYNGIVHLLAPVCANFQTISGALMWAQTEGQNRLRLFAACGAKNISSYNDRMWEKYSCEPPRIVIVIDDLSAFLNFSSESIDQVKNLLSIGRTVGIHIVAITQTPTAKHIKEISSMFFSKMVFQTASLPELRFMTGQKNPPVLSCSGDALFCSGATLSQIKTIAPGTSDFNEILNTAHCRTGDTDRYDGDMLQTAKKEEDGSTPEGVDNEYDELLPAAIEVVLEQDQASVSMLQRRLKLGYSRAARLVDQMEEKGIVGPFEGSKARQILITKEQWREMQHKQGMLDEAPVPKQDLVQKPGLKSEKENIQTSELLFHAPKEPILSRKKRIEISRKPQLLGCLKTYTVSIDDCFAGQLKCGQQINFEVEEGFHELSFSSSGKMEKETTIRTPSDNQTMKFSIELDLSGKLRLYKDD